MTDVVIGLDIGTSSTKAVAVDETGAVLATVRGDHTTQQPRPHWFEQDAQEVWWEQSADLLRALVTDPALIDARVRGIAVSGMGPCVVLCDQAGNPLRPAILYGIDMRASEQVRALTDELGADRILARGGSALSSQAVGPKLLWLQTFEPSTWAAARFWFSTSSFLVHRLTGRYVLDHHTASQCDPMYNIAAQCWDLEWAAAISPGVPLPELAWSDEVVGTVNAAAAARTGLPVGTPVLAGAVDAWAEAHSVGVRREGDLMVMYGSTMFLIAVDGGSTSAAGLWRTVGLHEGTKTLSAGMATSGLLADWVARTTGHSVEQLADAAALIPPGADGLVLLPYFAGERSPLFDPGARGVALGLSLAHTPAHLMRAAYEAVAMGVRHNFEAFDVAGARDRDWRAVAVGGGASSGVWPQIVSDVTGRPQHIPEHTIGASYGDALLAARAVGMVDAATDWATIARTVVPNPELAAFYDRRYLLYRELYETTRPLLSGL